VRVRAGEQEYGSRALTASVDPNDRRHEAREELTAFVFARILRTRAALREV